MPLYRPSAMTEWFRAHPEAGVDDPRVQVGISTLDVLTEWFRAHPEAGADDPRVQVGTRLEVLTAWFRPRELFLRRFAKKLLLHRVPSAVDEVIRRDVPSLAQDARED